MPKPDYRAKDPLVVFNKKTKSFTLLLKKIPEDGQPDNPTPLSVMLGTKDGLRLLRILQDIQQHYDLPVLLTPSDMEPLKGLKKKAN
ncbi:MAG: hypothetical protein ABL889_22165 [Terricaulis sp.]